MEYKACISLFSPLFRLDLDFWYLDRIIWSYPFMIRSLRKIRIECSIKKMKKEKSKPIMIDKVALYFAIFHVCLGCSILGISSYFMTLRQIVHHRLCLIKKKVFTRKSCCFKLCLSYSYPTCYFYILYAKLSHKVLTKPWWHDPA
jgi:hypothetical protein